MVGEADVEVAHLIWRRGYLVADCPLGVRDPEAHSGYPQRPRASDSRNPLIRSRVSSDIQLARTFSSVTAPASIAARTGLCSCCLVAAYAAGEYWPGCRPAPSAWLTTSSFGTTASIHPRANAVSASIVLACRAARAADIPIASRQISRAATGDGAPTASSVRPIVPPDISRTSAHMANTHPPAIACPLIAATTGAGWS